MRTPTRKLGAVGLAVALAVGAAACEGDDTTGAEDNGAVEDVVEETADEADELGSPTESPNTGDDVGDEETGEG